MKKGIHHKKIWLGFSVYLMAAMAHATEAGSQPMPWEGPLQKIMDSISGPVAQTLGVIVIVLAGLGIAFGESGSGVRKILMVVCGLAIAFTASSIVASLYNPSSGLSF
jgi:type IV secretory pathway VirB2 component (pilin)